MFQLEQRARSRSGMLRTWREEQALENETGCLMDRAPAPPPHPDPMEQAMMMITRTESRLELGIGEQQSFTIDVDRIMCAMLAAERLPCGRIAQALLLIVSGGADPIRIEGSPIELAEVHQYVIETMAGSGAGALRHMH